MEVDLLQEAPIGSDGSSPGQEQLVASELGSSPIDEVDEGLATVTTLAPAVDQVPTSEALEDEMTLDDVFVAAGGLEVDDLLETSLSRSEELGSGLYFQEVVARHPDEAEYGVEGTEASYPFGTTVGQGDGYEAVTHSSGSQVPIGMVTMSYGAWNPYEFGLVLLASVVVAIILAVIILACLAICCKGSDPSTSPRLRRSGFTSEFPLNLGESSRPQDNPPPYPMSTFRPPRPRSFPATSVDSACISVSGPRSRETSVNTFRPRDVPYGFDVATRAGFYLRQESDDAGESAYSRLVGLTLDPSAEASGPRIQARI